jgi:Flp pilus assembly protein protease CpaA
MFILEASYLIPTLVLFVAMITDLRDRKVYNRWVMISVVMVLANNYYFFGFEGLREGLYGMIMAGALTLPFVMGNVIGAGDAKILMAFGLGTTYSTAFSVIILSYVWAGILGLGLAVYNKKVLKVLSNAIRIIRSQKPELHELHQIPFCLAIFLAWITLIYLGVKQGALI